VLLSISPANASKIFGLMDDEEIRELSQIMATLGPVPPELVERLLQEFSNELLGNSSFVGNPKTTEQLLSNALGEDRVRTIMEEVRGPAGRNTWDKLGNVNETTLAAYLRNEYPQTVALIVSKISPAHGAKVLSALPEELAFEVIYRMLTMEVVKKEVLDGVERTLRGEFISSLAKTQKHDVTQMVAEIYNSFDRVNGQKFMSLLEARDEPVADKVKRLMFKFEDLIKVDPRGIPLILKGVDKSVLTVALKGASQEVKDLFISTMSSRAAKLLVEEMEALGPVRMRDVDDAQNTIIQVTRDLINKGEVFLASENSQDEMIL
jgi:flagellar motor switch protein FliG